MRRVLSLTLAFLWSSVPATVAQERAPTTTPSGSASVTVRDWHSIVVEESDQEGKDPGPARPTRRAKAAVPKTTYVYWDVEWFGATDFCLRRRSTTNAAIARGANDAKWHTAFALANGGVRAQCPARPPVGRTPTQAADDRARSFWDVRVLPDPVLKVVPDYAITGKLVYLQIGGAKDQRFDVQNPVGDDVSISATSRYVVDWGDSTETTTTSQGGPWPDGDITHSYTETAPSVTITVTQLWSATWRAGRAAGDLRDLQTTSTLTLPVTQLQAVRNI